MDIANGETYHDAVCRQYGDGTKEDARAAGARSQSLEFHYTKKALDEFVSKETRILEIGCATGYYGLYFADKCKEYVGVDLHPPHIELFRRKIAEQGLANLSCVIGDAVALPEIARESFDLVCCLGPMYHLPPEKRELVFAECARVLKKGGVAAFAFINKIGVYAGACVHDKARSVYPDRKANDYVLGLGTDDLRPGVFYYTMPEEMAEAAGRHGFRKIRCTGTDSFITASVVDAMDDEKFALYMELADKMNAYESCAGMSNHALLICVKD